MSSTFEIHSRRSARGILFLILLGIFLRAAQWAYRAPVWGDERAVVQNVESKTARQLMGPLTLNVAAPPAYLLALRGLYKTVGDSSFAYRIPALLCGCGAMALFALIARKLLQAAPALIITAIFALSDRLIWHSAEIKPYAADLFIACLMLWLFFAVENLPRRIVLISLVAIIGIWFSFPTVFVYAALMILLAQQGYRDWKNWLAGIVGTIFFAASIIAVYFLEVRHQRTAGLNRDWVSDYLPRTHPQRWLPWFFSELYGLCDYASKNMGGVVLVLMLLGIYFLLRLQNPRLRSASSAPAFPSPPFPSTDYRDESTSAFSVQRSALQNDPLPAYPRMGQNAILPASNPIPALLFPIVITLLAACFSFYPFGGSRATLFLVPCVFLLAGFGLQFLWDAFRPFGKFAALAVGIFLIAWMAGLAAYRIIRPRIRTPAIRSLAGYLHQHYQPSDAIYVWSDNGPGEFIDFWTHHVGSPADRLYDCDQDHFPDKFWLVLVDASQFDRRKHPDLAQLAAHSNIKQHYKIAGGDVYLYQTRVNSTQP